MHILQAHIHVKKENVKDFIEATLENARNSIKEPGIKRFDVLQDCNEPARFILHEVYIEEADAKKHKETNHYLTWRDTVATMMDEPRYGIQYRNLFPENKDWE